MGLTPFANVEATIVDSVFIGAHLARYGGVFTFLSDYKSVQVVERNNYYKHNQGKWGGVMMCRNCESVEIY